jgi:hypothetical protein
MLQYNAWQGYKQKKAEGTSIEQRNLYPVSQRTWGMLFTVIDHPNPGESVTYILRYNQASADLSDNDNWTELFT